MNWFMIKFNGTMYSQCGVLVCLLLMLFDVCCSAPSMRSIEPLEPIKPEGYLFPHGSIEVNLRLFYDDQLLALHDNSYHQVNEYLLSLVHAASLMYNSPPMSSLGEWHLVVQSIKWIDPIVVTLEPDRFGNDYRRKFGNLYAHTGTEPFSQMVLLTGYNFLFNSNRTDTKGLAIADSACNQSPSSAVIIEARTYAAGVILAHELGHTFGIDHHDEDLGCGSEHIMSANLGPGRTTFSQCSLHKVHHFFSQVFKRPETDPKRRCFAHRSTSPTMRFPTTLNLPYRSVSPSTQCALALGPSFVALAQHVLTNVCTRLTCSNAWVFINIHPALENTTCARGKHCRGGLCK